MQYGSIYLYKCPKCNSLLSKGSLLSGNTFGAKIFSDGKRIAPMLHEFPNLTKCRKCNHIFWLRKQQSIGSYERNEIFSSKWKGADSVAFLAIDDYYKAINLGLFENQGEELFIRQQIWWLFNDRLRNGKEIFNDESDEIRWKENVLALIELLDYNDVNQKIMIAEINRNLGNFETCINIINEIETGDLKWLQDKFKSECETKNRWVIQLN